MAGPEHVLSRERLLQVARAMPADLVVLSRLSEMLQDVNSDLDDVADLLRRDMSLAARVVRMSNSPMFGGARIGSVEEAVQRLGFAQIIKLVGAASAARASERNLDAYGIKAAAFRDHLIHTAFAAEAIGRAAGLDPRMAYLSGLLRPLGLMVLDRAIRDFQLALPPFRPDAWENYSTWEGANFGIDHSEVAGLILEEWLFPRTLVTAVRSHALRTAADASHALARVLHAACAVADRAGRGLPAEGIWCGGAAQPQCPGVTAEEMEEARKSMLAGAETAHELLAIEGLAAGAAPCTANGRRR